MTTLRLGIPSWIARRAIPVRHAPLSGATSTEVVVIGGGLTGSAVALAFAEAGLDVAVLEADRIGLGSTAASTALLMQEPDRDFDELAARYGRRTTERIWRSSIDATARLVATLRRLRIACDLEPRDSLYYATDARSAAALKKEHRARVNAGFGGDWLGPREAKAAAGFAAAARWHAARLQRHLASLYPSLARVGAAYAWEGLFATTPDGLPYIGPHRRYPRHLFALGYGGNGMTFGFLAAEMLLRHHQGRPFPEESLFSFGR